MTDPEVLRPQEGDPLQFAINAGEMLQHPRPVEEVSDSLQVLLVNMGCDLKTGGLGLRFQRVTERYGDQELSKDSTAYSALARSAAAAILNRDNWDVLPADAPTTHDDMSAATAVLLQGFMHTLSGGRRIVAKEIKYQQARFRNSSSYSAVGAVRYFDHVLDELDLTRPVDRITRVFRSFRAIRTFGGDIYA